MIKITNSGVPTGTGNSVCYEITEELTRKYCTGSAVSPIVTTTWKAVEQKLVGTILYVKMQAIVNVSYYPKGSNRMITDTFIEEFWECYSGSDATSAASFTQVDGVTEEALINQNCCCTAKGIRNTGMITFTFTA